MSFFIDDPGSGDDYDSRDEEGCDYHDNPQYDEWVKSMEETRKRLESTVMPEGMSVHTHHGSEGSSHDPYSFTEITVTMPDGRRIMYHGGLGEELEVDGEQVSFCEDDTAKKFLDLVGFDFDQLEWWGDEPYRCVPCMTCGREGCRGRCIE